MAPRHVAESATRDAADTDDDAMPMPPAKRSMLLQQGMEAESKAREKSNFNKSSLASNKVERLDEEKCPINISPGSSAIWSSLPEGFSKYKDPKLSE